MSSKQTAAIRADLKKAGITSRQVSVTARHYSSVRVELKDPLVSFSLVERIAKAHNEFRTDHVNEPLPGVCVTAEVGWEAERRAAEILAPTWGKVAEAAKADPGRIIRSGNLSVWYKVADRYQGHWIVTVGDGPSRDFYADQERPAVETLARALIFVGAVAPLEEAAPVRPPFREIVAGAIARLDGLRAEHAGRLAEETAEVVIRLAMARSQTYAWLMTRGFLEAVEGMKEEGKLMRRADRVLLGRHDGNPLRLTSRL